MKTAAVSKLKASLSEYLARVKAGEEAIVTERGKPIAKIVALSRGQAEVPSHLLELARAGLIPPGSAKFAQVCCSTPYPPYPTAAALKATIEERMRRRGRSATRP